MDVISHTYEVVTKWDDPALVAKVRQGWFYKDNGPEMALGIPGEWMSPLWKNSSI